MLQHARRGKERAAPATSHARYPEPVRGTPGRRALTESLAALPIDRYASTVGSAEREIEALKSTVLPAYLAVLRDKSLPPLERDIALARAGITLRHVLMTANQHVRVLEEAKTFDDPMVDYLRWAMSSLIRRARLVGAYRGFEQLVPQPYVEPSLKEQRVNTNSGRFGKTAHAKAPIPPARTAAPASIVRARPVPAAPARVPVARGAR